MSRGLRLGPGGAAVLVGAGVALAAACSDSYLFDQRREQQLPVDRSFALEGRFCTVGANEVVRPIKILIAMDASQSMRVTDPDGTRARATLELINSLPNDPEISIAVMVFAGSTTAFLTGPTGVQVQVSDGGVPASAFMQVVAMTDADKTRLTEIILNFTNPDVNRDATDFVKALSEIYAQINSDLSASSSDPSISAEARARYSVIFLSDGHPTANQDDELLHGDAVVRIRQLKALADDVRFSTVHVFNPVQPVSSACDLSGDAGASCPILLINQDAQRLEEMASLGGGDFRDFRNNEPINFLNFHFGQVRRAFTLKEVVATNFNAPPSSPLGQVDSDGDGLTDVDELNRVGTDPLKKDTDGDGFSDGVEDHFAALGGTFNPNQVMLPDGGGLDTGCPIELRGVDSDCDGLLDCDEQLIGSNGDLADTDRDGVPDAIEWQHKTQASSADLSLDPDLDGLINRDELERHTDPLISDSAQLTQVGYRYSVISDGPLDEHGRQCYRFRVDNISLANTLPVPQDAGTGDAGNPLYDGGYDRAPGYNDLMFTVAMVPGDDPSARTLIRAFRTQVPRYPVGGIKSPVDGVIHVAPDDLIDRCGTVVTAADAGVDGGP